MMHLIIKKTIIGIFDTRLVIDQYIMILSR